MTRIERMALIDNENRSMGTSPEPLLAAADSERTEPRRSVRRENPTVDSVLDATSSVDGPRVEDATAEDAPRVRLNFERQSPEQMRERANAVYASLQTRRSVREFSSAPIDLEVVRTCIDAAAQAPSGAHKQPWTFVLVTNPKIKAEIRAAAEDEEREFYENRAPQRWLDDLKPFATTPSKPFLEQAPALIVVFAQRHGEDGGRHYYVQESVGIATGMLISSLHQAGLATLTHTPSPMKFLGEILERPENERPFLLLPVGLPAEDCDVPAIARKVRSTYLVEK